MAVVVFFPAPTLKPTGGGNRPTVAASELEGKKTDENSILFPP